MALVKVSLSPHVAKLTEAAHSLQTFGSAVF